MQATMVNSEIEAVIFYSHSQNEIQELSTAIVPMAEHIRAVASDRERKRLRKILGGHFFRRKDVALVKNMLLRAAKHARGHLNEYFPTMQDPVIAAAENLEDAVQRYCETFRLKEADTIPVR